MDNTTNTTMKYLEIESLQKVTAFLSDRKVGARVLDGRVEAFSCKAAGDDKKLMKRLEQTMLEELATSPKPDVTAASPLGSLTDASTRTLLIRLISTLNASFPDYDFSTAKADDFVKEPDTRRVVFNINKALSDVTTESAGFTEQLWGAINEVIKLPECSVYSYIPDLDEDPLSTGTLWSFNYFFVNNTEKKIVFFTCLARSKNAARAATKRSEDDLSDNEGDMGVFDDDGTAAQQDDDADDDAFFDWDDDVDM